MIARALCMAIKGRFHPASAVVNRGTQTTKYGCAAIPVALSVCTSMLHTQFRHVRLRTLAKALAWLGVIACLALSASDARASVRSYGAAGDPQTTYTLRGRTLTISSTDPVVLQVVRGVHLLVMCQAAAPRAEGSRGFGRWPKSGSSLSVHIAGDPKHMVRCETIGDLRGFPYATAFSQVGLTNKWRHRLASTPPPGRLFAHILLSEDWMAVHEFVPSRFLNRIGALTHLPVAPALVHMLQRPLRRAGATLVYAATLADVAPGNVPAVVGQGSSAKRIEFAVRGLDGNLYMLRGRVGRFIGGSFSAVG
jgi:hypothetical protein